MKIINSEFTDEKDKLYAIGVVLLSLFLMFIPSLMVIFFLKEKVSVNTYEIAKAFFNLELFLFLISLFFAIPVIGWLIGIIGAPFICIFNIIVVIIALCAMSKGLEVKIPVPFEFI